VLLPAAAKVEKERKTVSFVTERKAVQRVSARYVKGAICKNLCILSSVG